MSSRDETTVPISRPKARMSLSHPPTANTMDKENMTADIGTLRSPQKTSSKQPKKSRSKSIGPGGLDALKNATGNRRKSIAAPQPRSILKPTIPPLQQIPAHSAARKINPKEAPQLNRGLGKLEKSQSSREDPLSRPVVSGTGNISNPFMTDPTSVDSETRVLFRTKEQQEANTKEREERQNLNSVKELEARREARRKSLASRRVSFAPEATLHTWDVVEYFQDSTVSSESTNSTRRVSSVLGGTLGSHHQTPGLLGSDPSEHPSTPPDPVDNTTLPSPAQHNLHQKRRRSSGIPPLNFNNPDDEFFSSSPSTGSSAAGDDLINPEFAGDDASDSNSDSDNEGTSMSLDVGNHTDMSIMSARSTSTSTGSSARLEEALQLAAHQAGTQGIGFDEHGQMRPTPDEEAVALFQPWAKNGKVQILIPSQDQENINPFSQAFKAEIATDESDDEAEDMTMEMTQAVGHIMPQQQPDEDITMEMTASVGGIMTTLAGNGKVHVPKNNPANRRQSTRRRSSTESFGDQTMDLTTVVGGIQQTEEMNDTQSIIEDGDMSMELTSVIGGVLAPGKVGSGANQSRRQSVTGLKSSQHKKRENSSESVDGETLDMTEAVGGILSMTGVHRHEETVDVDTGMNMTMAVGGILSKKPSGDDELWEGPELQPIAYNIEVARSPSFSMASPSSHLRGPAVTVASETGSPSLAAFRGKGLRRSGVRSASTTPKSSKKASSEETSPTKLPSPSKQSTPKRASVSGDINVQISSPNRRNTPRHGDAEGSTPGQVALKTPHELFRNNIAMDAPVLDFIPTPKKRRSSGVGVDRAGLGSPNVAALLDRRESIGEKAIVFNSSSFNNITRGVHFDDPQTMEKEIDMERQEELDREEGRKMMEREADIAEQEKDATINLKEMIQSLTPKKRPLHGRKSLHVGAARGILGKRPAELDQDDQDNDDDIEGIKRLKNHEGSPVKNIKLRAPPSKAETTGRLTRGSRQSLQDRTESFITPTMASSPENPLTVISPRGQGRLRDQKASFIADSVIPLVEKTLVDHPVVDEEDYGEERIQLQEFLNMTSIRFMELTTTKRRHTVAPNTGQGSMGASKYENNLGDTSLESCVVAGACVVPMLELFQHSCRELKKYISEGRGIVREIETETFEENPPLFREYMSAPPDVRILMDNQFKNVKTHARLLSKAMWYEWRMKLLEGLKDGLYKIGEGIERDADMLQHQQDLLDGCLPSLVESHDKVAEEKSDLQQIADELADCDQEDLTDARQKLLAVETDIEAKQQLIRDLRSRLQEKVTDVSAIHQKRQQCLGDIEVAERIREACRGWSASEGLAFKAKASDIEKRYGWAITGVVGSQVSLTYRRDIELVFDASSFKPNCSSNAPPSSLTSSRIDLWYVGATRELDPMPLTVEKDFFLQNIRECCRSLAQARTTVKELLNSVSTSWTRSVEIVDDICSINRIYPTEVAKTSDSSIVVRSTLLISPLGTKVMTEFNVVARSTESGLELAVEPHCVVVYGERFNEAKMTEFLTNRATRYGKDKFSWGNILRELEEKLLARGRK